MVIYKHYNTYDPDTMRRIYKRQETADAVRDWFCKLLHHMEAACPVETDEANVYLTSLEIC